MNVDIIIKCDFYIINCQKKTFSTCFQIVSSLTLVISSIRQWCIRLREETLITFSTYEHSNMEENAFFSTFIECYSSLKILCSTNKMRRGTTSSPIFLLTKHRKNSTSISRFNFSSSSVIKCNSNPYLKLRWYHASSSLSSYSTSNLKTSGTKGGYFDLIKDIVCPKLSISKIIKFHNRITCRAIGFSHFMKALHVTDSTSIQTNIRVSIVVHIISTSYEWLVFSIRLFINSNW